MATVGTLIFEMSANIARLQQDMDKAQSTVKGAMDSIGSAVSTAKSALAALGVAIGAHEFVDFIEGGVSSVAMLERLSLQTGITVETLSALRPVAAAAGTNMDAVAGMVAKLEKSMLSFAQTGGGKAAEAFKSLGMRQEEVAAGLKDMDSFLPRFAEKLLQTGIGGENVGLAMELMGKGASTALPFLAELARQHELVATRTKEQAEAARDLEREMIQVSQRTQLVKEDFSIGLTPALMQTVTAFNELNARGDGATKLGETLGTVLRYAATAAGSLWLALKDLGDGIGAFMAQVNALVHGDIDAMRAIGAERDLQAAKNEASFNAFQEGMLKDVAAVEHKTEAVREGLKVEEDYTKLFDMDTANRLKSIEAETAEYDKQLHAIAQAQDEAAKRAKKTSDLGRELGMTFQSAFEDAVVKGKSFSDVLKGIEEDIERIILREAITKPVASAVSNAVTSSGFSLSNLFGGGMASGGPVSAGMSYLVGENGPEMLTMGSSSGHITPNQSSPIYIDARGADQGAVARLEASFRKLNATVEYRAVGAVQRAYNQRGAVTPLG